MNRVIGTLACAIGALTVALGAFGAHALKPTLEAAGTTDVWKTAVDYQMWHTIALLACAMGSAKGRARNAAALFIGGIVLFSGSLYWLALDGPRWLGPITPLGGLAFIAGWVCLGVALMRSDMAKSTAE